MCTEKKVVVMFGDKVALRIANLYLKYGKNYILENISLSVEYGEICAVLGPNGAGKSTLLRCIDRLIKPQKGDIIVEGVPLHELNSRQLAKKIAFLPQEENVSFPYTAMEVVLMGRSPYIGIFSTPANVDKQQTADVLKLVGIEGLADTLFSNLSGGERKLVLIARALVQNARILLLDEPTNQLDFRNQFVILRTIRDIVKKKSISAMISLHDPNLAFRFSDKVVMLKNGRIIAQGDTYSTINESNLKKLYGVETRIMKQEKERVVLFIQ